MREVNLQTDTKRLEPCEDAFKYIYKGMSIKNYELEEDDDLYNPHLNCMMLKTRNDLYQCEKVVLNGNIIYGGDFEPQAERRQKNE